MNFARPSDVNFCTAQEETLLTHRANINRLLERAGILLSHFPHFEEGPVRPEFHKLAEDGLALIDAGGRAVVDERAKKQFFAFSRTVYGQVKVRTDGERLLVYTDSGQADLKEAYAYRMDDATGEPVPERVRQA